VRKRISRGPLVATALFLVAYLAPRAAGLRVNTSSSMPRGVYRVVDHELRRGAIVAVCLPEPVAELGMERHYLGPGECPGGAEPVVKAAVALAGDLVEVTSEGVSVDGTLLARSRPLATDRGGRPLLPFQERSILGPGQVWLHSPYETRSWDSRYYGPVGTEDILFVVEPLLTFR
jgi:conjugative transfer signal peptidase TraF